MVALLRMPREANTRSILASDGYPGATASSISVRTAAPPMRHESVVRLIADSSATPSVETRTGKRGELLRHIHADLRGARNQPRAGIFRQRCQEAREGDRADEPTPAAA